MSKSKMNQAVSGNASIPAHASAQAAAGESPAAPAQEPDIPIQEQLPTYIAVKINSLRPEGPVLAYASATLNGCFAIRGIKIINGEKGAFVSMPSYKTGSRFQDVCFPITKEFREQLHATVMEAYQQELAQISQRGQEPPAPVQKMD